MRISPKYPCLLEVWHESKQISTDSEIMLKNKKEMYDFFEEKFSHLAGFEIEYYIVQPQSRLDYHCVYKI